MRRGRRDGPRFKRGAPSACPGKLDANTKKNNNLGEMGLISCGRYLPLRLVSFDSLRGLLEHLLPCDLWGHSDLVQAFVDETDDGSRDFLVCPVRAVRSSYFGVLA